MGASQFWIGLPATIRMNDEPKWLSSALHVIQQATGQSVHPMTFASVSGGCIHVANRLETNCGSFFVKTGCGADADSMLRCEALGLRRLQEAGVATPQVIGCQLDSTEAVLVLQWIEPAQSGAPFFQRLGHALADLHLYSTEQSRFGFEQDNWIGATPQINTWCDSWIEFFATQRLGYQLKLARDNQLLNDTTSTLGDKLCQRLDRWLIEPQRVSLLHGDLWVGNFLCAENDRPFLIDPAAYYGDGEAEFGIISLFGGFAASFFETYHDKIPQLDGFADRLQIYKLYHLLNHLNLFGNSYQAACRQIIRRYA